MAPELTIINLYSPLSFSYLPYQYPQFSLEYWSVSLVRVLDSIFNNILSSACAFFRLIVRSATTYLTSPFSFVGHKWL